MKTVRSGSRVSIAAASFSIYAFQELREVLGDIDELRFIFTSPSFITEKVDKQRREFYIPRLNRERDLFGSEFEIKLRNELSLKAVAKECAEWIRKKACFKSNRTAKRMMGFINVDDTNYMPVTGFTTVDLGVERGDKAYQFVQRTDAPMSQFYLNLFDQIWNDNERLQAVTDQVLDNITNAYKENSRNSSTSSRSTIFSMSFLRIYPRMCCPMRLPVSSRARSGTNSTTFSVTQPSPSSINWRNTTAAYSPTP